MAFIFTMWNGKMVLGNHPYVVFIIELLAAE
jgi:hypothetical protein